GQHSAVEPAYHMNKRIGFPHMLNKLGIQASLNALAVFYLGAGYIHEAGLRIGLFLRIEYRGELIDPLIGDLDHSDVGFLASSIAPDFGREPGQCIENRCLTRSCETYQTYFHYFVS